MARPRPLSPADAGFLYAETREAPQHVGTLIRLQPPEDAPPEYLRGIHERLRAAPSVVSPWNLRLATPWFQYNPLHAWVEDEKFDLDYHVRRTAVPAPGDERELGTLVARLHASPLDLSKPLWELHVIEGLEDGGFALFVKVHHSLVDGYTLTKAHERAFTTDPDSAQSRLFYDVPLKTSAASDDLAASWADPAGLLRSAGQAARALGPLTRALTRLTWNRGPLVGTFQAPNTPFNERITRNRRFATQQYPLARLKRLAGASGTKLNDIALAACGGGIRRYLLELGELPDAPLVAFVPVNIRPEDDPGGGNAVGALLASMATDVADPVERLRAVHASTTEAKNQFVGMTPEAITAYSQTLMAPVGLQTLGAITGLGTPRVLFNVVVSNVPGPPEPLYFAGARVVAMYPASIVSHGLALNITLFSYAGQMHIGFTGCRDTVPHLQKLAVYTGEAVAELEQALALES
ncbi:diacylglycerol O-acyltransferase [Geodermatophilus normandii]|uniref:Diacylglycerol O-acyltransferase n=2 Tax=Geodermatophilus normandii TaxID=1137989 RepID=A0A317QLI7_9ACTN|nr:wax ester/triacylglycerol synthase family O-acyltransferase [Geodermatophilus normandii]PWW23687.1 diacylglycerol O-acyltransferase [Geodermatophilus normandii]